MELTLGSNQFVKLTGARGTTVEVLAGRVWITEAGRERDALVSPGMRYSVGGDGLVVIGTEDGAASIAPRVAMWPGAGRWLLGGVRAFCNRVRQGALERRTLSELESLSDRTLADIGLRRDQVGYAARGMLGR